MTSMQYCCHGPLEVHRHCPWKQLHCRQKLYWAGAQEHVLQLKHVRCTLVTQIVHHIFVFRGFAYMYVHVSLYNYVIMYVCISIYVCILYADRYVYKYGYVYLTILRNCSINIYTHTHNFLDGESACAPHLSKTTKAQALMAAQVGKSQAGG